MVVDKLLLTDKDVAQLLGISRTHVWDCSREGTLPKPYKFGINTRWKLSEILGVIDGLQHSA